MSKTVKAKSIYQYDNGEYEGHHFGGGGSLRSSGRIRKRIILGEKFDYGEKTKEKQNYVLYVSGQGQEKKEIEEMEQIYGVPKKHEKIIEKKEIIDNYQYHETKDIHKNNKKSQTHHQRLCSPFERIKLIKYSSYTNEPIQNGYKIIKTTDLVNKKDYSRDNGIKKNYNHDKSYTSKAKNYYDTNKENNNPNIYETYVPYSRNKTRNTTHIITNFKRSSSFGGNNPSNNQYKNNHGVNDFKQSGKIQINYKQPKEAYLPQHITNYEFQENNTIYNNNPSNTTINHGNRKTEYTQSKEYSLKTTTIKRKKNNTQIPMPENRNKFGSQSKPTKKPYEGPKFQYIGKDRPKSGNYPRRRPFPKQRQIKNPKKGYIPFGGHGTRVGQGPIGQIPKPIHKALEGDLTKQQEKQFSQRIERNTSYITIHESTNKSNIKTLSDFNEGGVTRKIKGNKSFSKLSSYESHKSENNSSKKFPGKGTVVGSSELDKNNEINSDLVTENTENTIIESNKIELKTCETDNNIIYEECRGESFCINGQNEMFKEIFCPVHGRRIIRVNNCKN